MTRLVFVALLAPLMAAQSIGSWPSFATPVLLEDKAETSAGVSVGDLNGDGLLDLVLAKGRHWPLHNRVLINDGKGSYTATNLGANPDRTYSTALADIDLDGDLDVVVSNDAPDRKLIYKNDGQGHFTEFATFGVASWTTRYITLADLNGDRYPDIVVANRGGDKAVPSFICFNDRAGRFGNCQPLPTQSATSIVAADFDGDGALDLFVPHRDGGQSLILWNDGKGTFTATTPIGPPDATARIGAAADLDGDGLLDLAFIEERKKATFIVLNRGKRHFGDPVALPGPARVPYSLAIADLNRDGSPDLVVGYVKFEGSIYFNKGKAKAFDEIKWNDGTGDVYGMVFSDVNGDGWQDIISARSGAPNAIWLAKPPANLKE